MFAITFTGAAEYEKTKKTPSAGQIVTIVAMMEHIIEGLGVRGMQLHSCASALHNIAAQRKGTSPNTYTALILSPARCRLHDYACPSLHIYTRHYARKPRTHYTRPSLHIYTRQYARKPRTHYTRPSLHIYTRQYARKPRTHYTLSSLHIYTRHYA